MSNLIHLIYSSVATVPFSPDDLHSLLDGARVYNKAHGVTGMLLFDHGSFFQVLEGEEEDVIALFEKIEKDPRHERVVTIIREPIHKRALEEWTMGYAEVSTGDVADIIGLNDFFNEGTTFGGVGPGRAKKLLNAFRAGSWRGKLTNHRAKTLSKSNREFKDKASASNDIQIVFQPIFSTHDQEILAYEALARSKREGRTMTDEGLFALFRRHTCADDFYAQSIREAAAQDSQQTYSINFFGKDLPSADASMQKIVDEMQRHGMKPGQFIIEIHQNHLIGSPDAFGSILQKYRAHGLRFLIDHFGAGRAGLNLLEPYRPDFIALNRFLVVGVHSNGPRQAIIKGLLQTCGDLGIDVVAKFVDDFDEYDWLRDAGVDCVQGDLFGVPTSKELAPPAVQHG